MASATNDLASRNGTRFRLFAQPSVVPGFSQPEIVTVSSPAGSVGPGPEDHRMYVVDPIGKELPYGPAENRFGFPVYFMPPWMGPVYPPALPDANGDFDYIPVDAPEFELAHLFGTVRFVLDVWEKYFGQRIEWHFAPDLPRMELVLQRNLLENAYMGYGFLEVGVHIGKNGTVAPFSLNFDVIAHEVGHCIIYSAVGVPDPGEADGEYYGFHESSADITALIAALHFDSVIDELFTETRGNLYLLNLVNRIAELSVHSQIRLAANSVSLADFVDGWHDEHKLAQPLTGAVFDILVDIFHEELVARGLISETAEDLSDQMEDRPDYHEVMQPVFDAAYEAAPQAFREALIQARDTVGYLLAETWRDLPQDNLTYADVGRTMFMVDQLMYGGRYARIIEVNLRRRGIGYVKVGPHLAGKAHDTHFNMASLYVPPEEDSLYSGRKLSYRELYEIAWGSEY